MKASSPVGEIGEAVRAIILPAFGEVLPKTVIKNMVLVVNAIMSLSCLNGGWYGRLTLWAIARTMSTDASVKSRRKRLGRFLNNKRFDVDKALAALVSLTGVEHWGSLVPILIDQTSLCNNAVQAIVASFVHNRRSVPIGMKTFDHTDIPDGQNILEWDFLSQLIDKLTPSIAPILVMDRGYAKLRHIKNLIENRALFVIRGCRNVIVQYGDSRGSHRLSLGRLPHRQGKAVRYRNVRYKDGEEQLVDIIVYRGRDFKEPWFLIVPPGSEEFLETARVVQWYRWRMKIETTFRDFKAQLGVRKGLQLRVDRPVRMARIMICLAIAYLFLLGLGDTGQARRTRKELEVRRRRSRHGTTRTLSALTVAMLTIQSLMLQDMARLVNLFFSLAEGWDKGIFSEAIDSILA